METRSLKQLFIILSDSEFYFTTGLCRLIRRLSSDHPLPTRDSLLITSKEVHILLRYVEKNRPKRNESGFKCTPDGFYYWSIGDWEACLDWINKQIKKLPNK